MSSHSKQKVTDILPRGLLVSCQALPEEPLHSSYIMSRMAYAAFLGGAVGIRAGGPADIQAIKQTVSLPIIGIQKRVYEDSEVFITPSWVEARAVADAGAEIIAIDATDRPRPGGITLAALVQRIRAAYPAVYLMADVSAFPEARQAEALGFDLIGSTLAGYTADTKGLPLPDVPLIAQMSRELSTPIIAEGGIWTLEQLDAVMEAGAYGVVVGSAITRPREITKRFFDRLDKHLSE